ncbi:MAG TPA: Ig-like domain-containing protein [Longimicrobiales bacterium]|nr:Ig-like domain-containing protein [Longimicrobiales bacterium]
MSLMARTARVLLILLVILVPLSCGDGDPSSPSPTPGPSGPGTSVTPARLVVEPGTVILTPGESFTLAAAGFDDAGVAVDVEPTWSSTDPGVVDVDSTGMVRAGMGAGSARITATAGGTAAAPVLVLVAVPAPGAILVPDSAVLSDAPDPVDASADYRPGWRYRVRISGSPPASGQVLLARGDAPVAGRVTDVEPDGTGSVVTLELLPLADLFQELAIDEAIPLDPSAAEVAQDLQGSYRLDHLPTGAMRLVPGGGAGVPGMGAPRGPGPVSLDQHNDFRLGPFRCETDGSLPSLDLPDPTFQVTPDLTLELKYGDGLERLVVAGTLSARAEYAPRFTAVFEGTVDCSARLFTFPLPLGGPLAFFVGGQVPVGMGLELSAKITVAEIGYTVAAEATATARSGLACDGACQVVSEFTSDEDASFELIAPDITTQFRAELGAWGGVEAGLALGSRWLKQSQFELAKGRAGAEQRVDLATSHAQAQDDAYASGFQLLARSEVGPGAGLQKILDLLEISAASATLQVVDTLASSPGGTISASASTAEVGDSVDITLQVEPPTYAGIRSIDRVAVLRRAIEGDDTTWAPLPGQCADIAAVSGQTEFTCRTGFTQDDRGEQVLRGFVHPRLFTVPLPVPLELGPDASVIVDVLGGLDLYIRMPGTLTPGIPATLEVLVGRTTAQGTEWGPGFQVDLDVTGGEVGSASGTTGAGGVFGTTVTLAEDSQEVVVNVTASDDAGQSISGTARATVAPAKNVEVRSISLRIAPFGQGVNSPCEENGYETFEWTVPDTAGLPPESNSLTREVRATCSHGTSSATATISYTLTFDPVTGYLKRIDGTASASAGGNRQEDGSSGEARAQSEASLGMMIRPYERVRVRGGLTCTSTRSGNGDVHGAGVTINGTGPQECTETTFETVLNAWPSGHYSMGAGVNMGVPLDYYYAPAASGSASASQSFWIEFY